MTSTNALAVRVETSLIPNPSDFQTMLQMSAELVKSGYLPESIRTPAQALAIFQFGVELGLKPMTAFSQINIIQQKPSASPALMRSLIWRGYGHKAFQIVENTAERCTIKCQPPGNDDPILVTFTMAEARKIKAKYNKDTKQWSMLTDSVTWQNYPDAMLLARCTAKAARAHFSDSIMGLYSPDELGADVQVNAEGDVIFAEVTDAGAPITKGGVGIEVGTTLSNTAPASPSYPSYVKPRTLSDGTVVDTMTGVVLESAADAEIIEGEPPTKKQFDAAINGWLDHTGKDSTNAVFRELGKEAGVTSRTWTDGDKAKIVAYVNTLLAASPPTAPEPPEPEAETSDDPELAYAY